MILEGSVLKKVKPEIAKNLAKLAEQGIKKFTKAILETTLAVVKGVTKAVFEVIRGEKS